MMEMMLVCVSTGVDSISLTISCRVSRYSLTSSSYGSGWIRQREGKPMDWILLVWSDGSSKQNEALKNMFSFNRDTSAGTVYLQMNSLRAEDSAVYYCTRHTQYKTTLPTTE
uniref:Ig-like domain-containing protein n=1 Tax=Oryzias melastigma TaxID=30732 RepID=A0A3B3CFP6_ORYME